MARRLHELMATSEKRSLLELKRLDEDVEHAEYRDPGLARDGVNPCGYWIRSNDAGRPSLYVRRRRHQCWQSRVADIRRPVCRHQFRHRHNLDS